MFLIFCVLTHVLCLAVAGEQLFQDQMSWTRREGQRVSFSCTGTEKCYYNKVYWYQQREGEPFTLILHITRSNGYIHSDYNHTQKDDFSSVKRENNYELEIKSVKQNHSATYYCSCLKKLWLERIFGPGTRLYVTDKKVEKPKVTVYPVSNPLSNGKTILLCQASGMFPDLVKISWKKEKCDGPSVEVSETEGEVLEQREQGYMTSMLIIDKYEAETNKYNCIVKHEGINLENPKDTFQSMCSLNLASLVYTVMVVKSIVYSCGLSLLLTNRDNQISRA